MVFDMFIAKLFATYTEHICITFTVGKSTSNNQLSQPLAEGVETRPQTLHCGRHNCPRHVAPSALKNVSNAEFHF